MKVISIKTSEKEQADSKKEIKDNRKKKFISVWLHSEIFMFSDLSHRQYFSCTRLSTRFPFANTTLSDIAILSEIK